MKTWSGVFSYVGGAILGSALYSLGNETVRGWLFGICLGVALVWAIRAWERRHD